MKIVFALSGPVAVGKSKLADQLVQRFGAKRISTRQLLIERGGVDNERGALIEAGKQLDLDTDGAWVLQQIQPHAAACGENDILLIDSVRTRRQVEHLRSAFGDRFVHVHVTAPLPVIEERYRARAAVSDEQRSYDDVRADLTEAGVWDLKDVANVVVENDRCEAASLLARATAGLGLYPSAVTPLVDVLVGGQYGSEGKGNICAYLAGDYQLLMRVGGPNAGHLVADPRYKYVQLPSGTQSNPKAKILIGAGATIWVPQMLKEIADCCLTPDRLIIDRQAMIIEPADRVFEGTSLDVIGSTKQGVGAATARKIVGRDQKQHFGSVVHLAESHPDLKPFVGSTLEALDDAYAANHRVMLEGTQGTSLSLHHGKYPYVTSRETTASGCLADAGIGPGRVRRVIMVTRTYPIRVGGTSGPMANEISAQVIADRSDLPAGQIDATEVGTVSGKKRRIGEFDWDQLRRSASLNGATDIALTFVDYLNAENQNAKTFETLSARTRSFINEVERVANAPVSLISKQFGRDGIIDRRQW